MPSIAPNVSISVKNFGPIQEGEVDLRPLTVFVGPSNAGKTYLAVLIYALSRSLDGFRRPPGLDFRYSWEGVSDEDCLDIAKKLNTKNRPFRFKDLPESIRNKVLSNSSDHTANVNKSPDLELERCFDIESLTDLIHWSDSNSTQANVSLAISENDRSAWRFGMEIHSPQSSSDYHLNFSPITQEVSDVKYNFEINELILVPSDRSSIPPGLDFMMQEIRDLDLERVSKKRKRWKKNYADTVRNSIRLFLDILFTQESRLRDSWNNIRAYYLPAARGGIMQSHRVIASSLVSRSTRVGLERFPEIPTFSGMMADFMQELILYKESPSSLGENRKSSLKYMEQKRRLWRRKLGDIADALEQETLNGHIRAKTLSSGIYPDFIYEPFGTKRELRMTRASSMISELAPIVLFLRGAVLPGDTLIIEEPEAHLHPAAQTQMALTLARLTRVGVQVIVTTHSDWLLKEIGNLIREGELSEDSGSSSDNVSLPSALQSKDVGVWLFSRDNAEQGSKVTEVPFDRSEGIEPEEYDRVAEKLYNRSAGLQNLLELQREDGDI